MPQRRRRRCSASASLASLVIRLRSQFGSCSVIVEPLEVNLAVALYDPQLQQPAAVTGAAHAQAACRVVGRAVSGAEKIASVGVEKYSFLPVQFHRDVRAAVEIRVHSAFVSDGKSGRRFAEILDLEAYAAAGVGKRARFADQPFVASHSPSSGTLATQPRGPQAR